MQEYPHILGPNQAPHLPCIAFYKYDGSSLRFEYTRKRGWHKFGTKTGLFDHTHEIYGSAVEIFKKKYAEAIEKIIKDSKNYRNANNVIAYTEFFGPNSFAGSHEPNDPKDLMLFDVSIDKKGLLGPREFIKSFGKIEIAKVVYEGILNASFVNDVKQGKYDLVEGVVCKGGSGESLWMMKVKTLAYLERLKTKFTNWEEFWE